jgi:hypothetical protein
VPFSLSFSLSLHPYQPQSPYQSGLFFFFPFFFFLVSIPARRPPYCTSSRAAGFPRFRLARLGRPCPRQQNPAVALPHITSPPKPHFVWSGLVRRLSGLLLAPSRSAQGSIVVIHSQNAVPPGVIPVRFANLLKPPSAIVAKSRPPPSNPWIIFAVACLFVSLSLSCRCRCCCRRCPHLPRRVQSSSAMPAHRAE